MNSNMTRRTIMIFPQFENVDIIDEIRKKYDPLANHVRPHITLAFTFESNLTSMELEQHLNKVLNEIKPFKLTLEEIIKIDNALGMYLFLTVNQGKKQIKELSKKLYTGILEKYKPHWLNDETFLPHMTIGTFTSKKALNEAFLDALQNVHKEKFSTIVDKISVEIIDENEDSIIDVEVNLNI